MIRSVIKTILLIAITLIVIALIKEYSYNKPEGGMGKQEMIDNDV